MCSNGISYKTQHSLDGSSVSLTGPATSKFSRTPVRVRHGAPRPNQHTDEIPGEVGVTKEQLAKLREPLE